MLFLEDKRARCKGKEKTEGKGDVQSKIKLFEKGQLDPKNKEKVRNEPLKRSNMISFLELPAWGKNGGKKKIAFEIVRKVTTHTQHNWHNLLRKTTPCEQEEDEGKRA